MVVLNLVVLACVLRATTMKGRHTAAFMVKKSAPREKILATPVNGTFNGVTGGGRPPRVTLSRK